MPDPTPCHPDEHLEFLRGIDETTHRYSAKPLARGNKGTSESSTEAWGRRRSALTGKADDGSTGPEVSGRRWQSARGESKLDTCMTFMKY